LIKRAKKARRRYAGFTVAGHHFYDADRTGPECREKSIMKASTENDGITQKRRNEARKRCQGTVPGAERI